MLAALFVFSTRFAFVPSTLEDLDSTNFARALGDFDPGQHRPHPPGYPLYVAIAKALAWFVPHPATALATLSAIAQALLVLPLLALFSELGPTRIPATLLVLSGPVLWFNGARPMSDSVGLLFIVATQALLIRSMRTGGGLAFAAFLAGLAPGARLQSIFLTIPLLALAMLRAHGQRRRAVLAFFGGTALWLLPLVTLSGGPARYFAAFSSTLGQAVASEPLLSGFTLNRAARALSLALVTPWAEPALGRVLLILGGIGFLSAARQRPASLGLALLAYAPYLGVHLLLQHVETVRYALPYLPFLCWLAVEGLAFLASPFPDAVRQRAVLASAGAIALWSATLTLPALRAYSKTPSPQHQALRELARVAKPPGAFVLGAHFIYRPYLSETEEPVERLFAARPGQSMRRLATYWLEGGTKPVLFLADPRRTDLESIDRRAIRSLGSWSWPFKDAVFLAGGRPNRAELLQISPARFFAGEGFLLSLEAGLLQEQSKRIERRAWLKPLATDSFLILAGEPTAPAAQHTLEVAVAGARLFTAGGGEPLLRGQLLVSRAGDAGYAALEVRTSRGGAPEGAPFVLNGLDYGPVTEPGFAHGHGWFYPERDERALAFRWASAHARSLIHVPPGGARLVIEGQAPLEYLGGGGSLWLSIDGVRRSSVRLDQARFRIETPLEPGAPFREVLLESDQAFVPDKLQFNGDRRRLSVRVYSFRLEAP